MEYHFFRQLIKKIKIKTLFKLKIIISKKNLFLKKKSVSIIFLTLN